MMKALSFFSLITFSDILILLGLVSVGSGLFLCFSLGWALVGVGAVLLAIGVFGRK